MRMIASPINIKEVSSHRELKQFIYLPQSIYKGYNNWVPPVYDDEWKLHNKKHNKSLAACDVVKAIAYKNDTPVGRVMGIIHHEYNGRHNEKTARFFQFDCIDDNNTASALLNFVEQWARAKGMTLIIGPFGFSDKDPQGAQIEGFEHLPVLVTPTNPPYLPKLIEAEGYIKNEDCVSYKLPVPERLPEQYEYIYRRLSANKKFELVEFTSKKQMKPYIVPVLRLVNETYAPLFGFVPMSEPEMKKLAAQYMFVLDPGCIKIIQTTEKEIVAFIVAMPDMSRGLQKAKGKILPFGFLYMLNDARRNTQLNLMLGAIKQRYRGIGLNVLLAKALITTAAKRGFTLIDSHLILENNTRMCAELSNLGGVIYKRYRIYKKELV
ncbi:MAG TPA: hypothetical protein VG738_15940 [Chitinophagaceae bacterium]|nr:hypothetical protein [Chitinophagaceae bacterium]